ncbi:MAG: tetratricopeptide repeat protein, partial [Actinobacteria bacterium]|nr:tetratricopeptide repeat protein [Actinomycetota bacterium]
ALDIDPAEPLAHAVLARVAAAEDHRQNAVAEAQEALIAGSEDGLALSGVAWTYGVLGDWEEAVRYSEQAVSREPNHPGLRLQLAEAYREEERYRDAMDAATEALALDQGWETKAHASLGHTLRRQEKYSEAMAEFREALALDPDNDHAAWGLGACLFRQESYEEALPHLERAVDVVPNNANYQNWLGVCYYRLENYEDALPHLERAVEEDSSDADFLCWEAWCYYKLSRYDEARAEVTAALELDPDVEDGQELVDKLDVL